jgi:hypothetical protein
LKLNTEPFFGFDPKTRKEVWSRRRRRCIIAFNATQATPSVNIRPRRAQRGNLLHVCANPGVLAFESSTHTTIRPPTSGPSWRGPQSFYVQHARVPLLCLLGWIWRPVLGSLLGFIFWFIVGTIFCSHFCHQSCSLCGCSHFRFGSKTDGLGAHFLVSFSEPPK